MERSTSRISRELLAIPGVQSAGAHIGQALLGEEVAGVNLGEIWVSLIPQRGLLGDAGPDPVRRQRLPGPVPRGADLPRRADPGGAHRRRRNPSSCARTARICKTCARNPTRSWPWCGPVPGVVGRAPGHLSDIPQVECEGQPREGRAGTASSRATSAGTPPPWWRVRRSGTSSGPARHTTSWSGARNGPAQLHRHREPARSTRRPAGGSGSARSRASRCARIRTPSTGRATRATSTWGGGVRAATSGRWSMTSSRSWPRCAWPAGTTPNCWASTRNGRRRRAACCESAIIAAVLILLLLQASFRRWRLAVLTFLTLPMALVGGVLAAWIGGGIVSLGALVGFFTVFGIAARNGILLINHWQHLEEDEGMAFGPQLVLRGARERLAPILMTSLATGLALVPLVVLGRAAGTRDRAPAGRGHSRRAGHLHPAEPLRGAVAVPAVRSRQPLPAAPPRARKKRRRT